MRFFFCLLTVMTLNLSAEVQYNRDVRPILSENCFFCHGFDEEKREADLRLDTFAGATKDGAVVPGHPEKSETIARIFTKDPEDQMPPHDSAYRLTEKEKDTLRQWISEGANYEEHWAFAKLERPKVPKLEKNPIDSFLRRTWNQNDVDPVGKANPRVLLRRLSYDLRGLPPTPDEVAAFLKNPTEDHYLKFVEKWLTSLEHAEHQALLWLDLVRYADSNGMVSDEPIASGPYRKYVIEAFRDNMSFDQFTREQLAGDLLPDRNDRTLTASAYNRLVLTNCEAGVIEKEALYALKNEHVRALGTVWLGLTTGCAECHDHKYDPITAKDYYSLAAFFDPLIEAGVYEPGDRRVPIHYLHDDPKKSQLEHQLVAQIDKIREQLYAPPIDRKGLEEWSKNVLAEEAAAKKSKELADWIWISKQATPATVIEGEFEVTPEGRVVTANENEVSRHAIAETQTATVFGKNEEYFAKVTLDATNPPSAIALQVLNGAYRRIGWHPEYQMTYYWGEKDDPGILKASPRSPVYLGPLPEAGKEIRLVIPKSKFQKAAYKPLGMGFMQVGGKATWGDAGYRTTAHQVFLNQTSEPIFRYFWELPLNRDDRDDLPSMLTKSLRMDPAKRRPIHEKVIEISYRKHLNPELDAKLRELYRQAALLRQDATEVLVSKEGRPKKTRVLSRGNFMDESGPIATAAIPEVFGKLESQNPTRLDLANWILAEENPLTARVYVNRLWHQFFGRGISETLEDSGNQGDWPSHLDLLNWLAADFRTDWDIRRMIRLLVTSDSYQLSSIPGSLLAQSDPTNRLHARQGRGRLTAEEIRDSALLAAGLLKMTEKVPSESFFPYQPEAYWAKSNKIMYGSRYQIWDTSPGREQYQRSLYTFWKRQNIHPAMLAFDAPTRQECTSRRTITNTPAQALALLNDPQFVEAARVLASKIMEAPDPYVELHQRVLQREPTPEEREELEKLHAKMLENFTKNPEEAKSLGKIGQAKQSEQDPVKLAAWTATARIILNLHEFITKP